MRRTPALFVVVGVVAGLSGQPVQAQQTQTPGFWVSLAAGAGGGTSTSDHNEFWFESPHAPPISVSQVSGAGTIQATTAGGSTYFSGVGTPILLPTTDGFATLSSTGSSYPASALPRFAGGTQASGAPQGGVPIPANADQLALSLSSPTAKGSQVLSVSVTSPDSTALGQTSVSVPSNGWWVVGLGPGIQSATTNPVGNPTPPTLPPQSSGGAGNGGGNNGGVTTPEPASVLLFGVGGLTAVSWRLRRCKFRPWSLLMLGKQ